MLELKVFYDVIIIYDVPRHSDWGIAVACAKKEGEIYGKYSTCSRVWPGVVTGSPVCPLLVALYWGEGRV